MTNMPYEIVLTRIVTALDLEFEWALHYHNNRYDSDIDYGLPGPFRRPVCIYLVSTTEAPSTPHPTRGHNVSPLQSHQSDPGMSCLSAKETAND